MYKIAEQDKETIDKLAKEVPESDKTVCRETELVRVIRSARSG